MSILKKDAKSAKAKVKQKRSYKKPKVNSEKIIAFGAGCNGIGGGGKKSAAGTPDFCSISRLLS